MFVGNNINAGIYVFNKTVLNHIELRNLSLERETFPFFANRQQLYIMPLTGFWKDIGQPYDFVACSQIYLNYFMETGRKQIDEFELIVNRNNIKGINLIHKSARASDKAFIGPFCVIH